MAAKWGVLSWLLQGGSAPLVDIFTQAIADMVDFHVSGVFQALPSQDHYLRIQVSRSFVSDDDQVIRTVKLCFTHRVCVTYKILSY